MKTKPYDAVMLVIALVGTIVGFRQCQIAALERKEKLAAISLAEQEKAKAAQANRDREHAEFIVNQMGVDVNTYAREYRRKLDTIAQALLELERAQEKNVAEALLRPQQDLRVSMLALGDFVKKYRSLIEALSKTLNSRLDQATKAANEGNFPGLVENVRILLQNKEADLDTIRREVEKLKASGVGIAR